MLRFFSKIRLKLAAENKPVKYIRYAIGEIVLVVIGILIALQINNWNEKRKIGLKEIAVLNDILQSIKSDLFDYKRFDDKRLERKKNGLDSLNSYIFDSKNISDSLFIAFYQDMKQDFHIRFDNGPFEALKSAGLEIISNDSLRALINNTYTVVLPAYKLPVDEVYNRNETEISKYEHIILKLHPVIHKDGQKHLDLIPKVDQIIKNEYFFWIYNLEQEKYSEYVLRLNQIIKRLNNLENKIEEELKSLSRK